MNHTIANVEYVSPNCLPKNSSGLMSRRSVVWNVIAVCLQCVCSVFAVCCSVVQCVAAKQRRESEKRVCCDIVIPHLCAVCAIVEIHTHNESVAV